MLSYLHCACTWIIIHNTQYMIMNSRFNVTLSFELYMNTVCRENPHIKYNLRKEIATNNIKPKANRV